MIQDSDIQMQIYPYEPPYPLHDYINGIIIGSHEPNTPSNLNTGSHEPITTTSLNIGSHKPITTTSLDIGSRNHNFNNLIQCNYMTIAYLSDYSQLIITYNLTTYGFYSHLTLLSILSIIKLIYPSRPPNSKFAPN